MITRWCHGLIGFYYSGARSKFAEGMGQLEQIQRERLQQIIRNVQESTTWSQLNSSESYESLAAKLNIRNYTDYKDLILEQKQTGTAIVAPDLVRFEPTSGSTEQRKWIPYSRHFLSEINKAAGAWLGDIYQRYPDVKKGSHYWSLSWLPEELRALTSSNDADLFPWYQRLILKQTMAVPSELSHLKRPEAAWRASLMYLAANENLSLVSVWSPTYWLKLVQDIQQNWSEISQLLTEGSWGDLHEELAPVLGEAPQRYTKQLYVEDSDFFEKLWPRLTLISAWDSSSSAAWAQRVKELFPRAIFQGKGLWATEGVVTIPFQDKKVLATQSHFYEFRDLQSGEVLPSWKIERNKEYQPILWTSSGLLRYPLQDRVKVIDFFGKTPCLEFMGRLQSVDLVGEKIDAQWVQKLLHENPQWRGLCLVACRKPAPHYILICESHGPVDIEPALLELHHYKVARELGQLQRASSVSVQDVFQFLTKVGRSQVLGQNKMEVLLELESLPS